MTDRNAILEALARAILQNSNADISPTPDLPSDKNPMVKLMREWETAMGQAAAVLELVGPRELMWEAEYIAATGLNNWTCKTPHGNELRVFRAWWGMQNVWGYVFDGEFYYTDVAAQAAAQAHADAAHWKNTKIGGE